MVKPSQSLRVECQVVGFLVTRSVVYVDIDAHNRNRSIFETLLPRESASKVIYHYIDNSV